MSDYSAVQQALEDGAQPSMLCATCPWDRTCVTPPAMTKAEIDAKVAEASRKDDERAAEARASGQQVPMPVGSLLTALTFGARDTMGQFCPVFSLRLRSSGGRGIADSVKSAMQGWDDES